MPYFSIITTAVTPLTIQSVLMECTVYLAIVSSHYMPSCDDCCVLCRDIWCKIKVDKHKLKSHPRIITRCTVHSVYN